TGNFGQRFAKRNFNGFYGRMGESYRSFGKTVDVYDVFRCGMVHEYTMKRSADIFMLRADEPCGLGQRANGRLFFVVERYLDDFMAAARSLYTEVMAAENPQLPIRVS